MTFLAATSDRLANLDFAAHNAEVRSVWDAFHNRKPIRVPAVVGTNTRFFMLNPEANDTGVQFKEYSEDPDVMFDTQLRFQRWSKFNLMQDVELGIPERWWTSVDFQNYYEAAWFGCKVHYIVGQVPDTQPDFADNPERVMEHGLPDPFDGLFAKGQQYYEHLKERAKAGFMDRPVDVAAPGMGTDGPMTVACNLFGADFVCETMAEDPDRLHLLFDFITQASILRMAAWRAVGGIEGKNDGFGIADDSVALISTTMYKEHVLPFHRRFFEAFGTGKGHGIHLCGNATRHFKTIVEELGVDNFDTGFPVDFAKLREELGPDVLIQGGPHIEFLRTRTPAEVYEESRRILQSGVMAGGRFLLREGNNLAPGTPLENIEAMHQAAVDFGKYGE